MQFQVKREGKNKGRWFYTCPIDRTKGRPGEPANCDFFLWAEDARERESKAGSGLTTPQKKLRQMTLTTAVTPRAEGPRGTVVEKTPISKLPGNMTASGGSAAADRGGGSTVNVAAHKGGGRDGVHDDSTDDEGVDNATLTEVMEAVSASQQSTRSQSSQSQLQLQTPASTAAGSKRKCIDDDDEFDDMSSGDEEQMVALAESASQTQKRQDVYSTPSNPKTVDVIGGMPTPLTDKPVRRVLFTDPEVQQPVVGGANKRQRTNEAGNFVTSTPLLSQTKSPGSGIGSVTDEVMALLNGQNIDKKTLFQVRNALLKHDAKAKGLERGRDLSREAVKKAEAKTAEVQARLTDVENRMQLEYESRKRLKSVRS